MTEKLWWQLSIAESVTAVGSNIEGGLPSNEVKERQTRFNNSLDSGKQIQPLVLLLNQFTDTMVLVLLGATVISGLVGAMGDALTIMAIVILNAVLGFIQEYRAEKSLDEIKKLVSPHAVVLRDGKTIKIPSQELVPGDLVFLEAGDKVPADLRLISSSGLEIDESALTGESVPVEKNAEDICLADTLLAEKSNMAFLGTSVTRGRGRALVVETGMNTVMGQIAGMMKETEKNMTPLQVRLDQLGKILIAICLLVCALVALLGIWRGESILTMFMAGISLAVAAIPEGLPAIVTVVLALGVQRMAKHNAIVRKLPAVETLGCTTVICSDKTGTLTRNQMTVRKLAVMDKTVEIEGDGYEPRGKFTWAGRSIQALNDKNLKMILNIALNCNQSALRQEKNGYGVQGDPTEGALLVMAAKAGLKNKLEILREIPFDSERKRMSVVVQEQGQYYLLVKGALDYIIPYCSRVVKNDTVKSLENTEKQAFINMQEAWASDALRVLGFAYKPLIQDNWKKKNDLELETDLILAGICGMIDPPRPGALRSVKKCQRAGIVPVMITGDHPLTASAIAREIGISKENRVISGGEIDHLTDSELYKRVLQDRVVARVSPQHKNRIVNVLKAHQQVVAMTGDGVNDAPAIKTADIGIAMGISGTQVTKESAGMILTDDDFSTIVRAIYEGRAIYDNIRKFIRYLLGGNIGEVLVMFLATLMGTPLPMLPIQILWVNLVTDGLPAMALGIEPPEPGIMNRPPRPKNESIFARGLGWIILSRGTYIAMISLATFLIGYYWSHQHGMDGLDLGRTMAFTTLVFAQLFYVFECRSEQYSPFELGFFKNKFLIGAVLISIIMQLFVIYLPTLQNVFATVPLEGWQWAIILLASGFRIILRFILYTWQRFFVFNRGYAKI